MSEKRILKAHARFGCRADTRANWEAVNPILLAGEHGAVTDGSESEREKIGDGVTPWNELPWWRGPKGEKGDKGDTGGVGEATAEGGEIFNDYENNQAVVPFTTAHGTNTVAGIKGYRIMSSDLYDSAHMLVTVDDVNLDEKAYDKYDIGDIVQYDAEKHHYNNFVIQDKTVNSDGYTMLIIVKRNDGNITENVSLNSNANDNWVWVLGKSYGEPVFRNRGSNANGNDVFVAGLGAFGAGAHLVIVGDGSAGFGIEGTATSRAAFVGGVGCSVLGNNGFAVNSHTTAGSDAFAAGSSDNKAQDVIPFPIESNLTADQKNAIIEAWKTNKFLLATSAASQAMGVNALALAWGASACGRDTKATGQYSRSIGLNTEATNDASFAGGNGTKAIGHSQFVIGKFNEPSDAWNATVSAANDLFIIGNGSSDTNRSNAFVVKADGSARLQKTGSTTDSVATKGYVDEQLAVIKQALANLGVTL